MRLEHIYEGLSCIYMIGEPKRVFGPFQCLADAAATASYQRMLARNLGSDAIYYTCQMYDWPGGPAKVVISLDKTEWYPALLEDEEYINQLIYYRQNFRKPT